MKAKVRNPVPVKWVFKIKEDPGRLICMELINVVKGYMQLPLIRFIESFLSVASYTLTRTLIVMALYCE